MIVGEQPGDRGDLVGRPFVGAGGHLPDEAFKALGWDREREFQRWVADLALASDVLETH